MRKIVLYGVIIFQILLIISLVRGIQLSTRSRERINKLEQERDQLIAEREELTRMEEYVGSEYYLEKVAREELNLAKPGETVVLVPDLVVVEKSGGEADRGEGEKANWQKWWEVLYPAIH